MSHRYLVLVESQGRAASPQAAIIEAALAAAGMPLRHVAAPIRVYAAPDTPILALPDGGLLIGELFTRDGRPIATAPSLPPLASPSVQHAHLLEHYWGDYLMLQPGAYGPRSLAVLRDPSGSVRCVHSLQHGAGFLTSDITLTTALGLYRKQIDWDFIAHFLRYPNHKTGRTGLAGITELLPGCSLHLRGHAVTTTLAWSPWAFVAAPNQFDDPREAASQVRHSISTVVQTWAATDGNVLLELSGGLDSSVVAACLARTQAQVNCRTLLTPVPGADERPYAGLVAAHLGLALQATELPFEAARFDAAPQPQAVVPCGSALQYATDTAMQAAGDTHQVTSFYSGGGGDTVFCYLASAAPAADAFRQNGLAAATAAIRDLAELHQCTFWKAARLTVRKLMTAPKSPSRADGSFLNPAHEPEEAADHPWFVAPADALPGDRERIIGLAGTQFFRESAPRGALRRLRMPLLSQPVVETCLRVPSWMWIEGGRNRAVARSAFTGWLPQDILARRSKGSFVSYSGGAFRRNRNRIRELLLTGHLRAHDLLDVPALEAAFDNGSRIDDDALQRLIDLCMVENWVRHQF
ncbi:asparagine synthase C-terminal domain-containing protein [Xanthomonas arboricola]|uniref:asparagine synthase-related protein n=1 Tax=Xanthomonas arboricola TaxID=56448 RepID=UPI000CEE7B45|nr:asparagine synthase C-terminal domain-containing protein [Xanthomonas arboricola]PPT46448.1 hypothetical protein XarjCFBP7652_17610 [Xanthomonas arboricola]